MYIESNGKMSELKKLRTITNVMNGSCSIFLRVDQMASFSDFKAFPTPSAFRVEADVRQSATDYLG